jgi:hypothetical protein
MGMTIDDLKKECRYCCREIDASGLEGFRCTNKTVIKTTGSSWCYHKNANEPCSKCDYCKPKEEMKMSIDLAMNNLSEILTEATEDENSVCYVTDVDEPTLKTAIDIMRKYKEIKELMVGWNNFNSYEKMCAIYEVIEDGN